MKKLFVCLSLLISSCFAKIPPTEMWGLLEATKPEYRQYSPFWESVALNGGMLEALRFYGNYTLSTSSQARRVDVSVSNDPIAQLIQNFFPSPDGASFLPNTRMRDPVGFLSRHLESVNDIIGVLISCEVDKKSKILDILRPKKEGKFVKKGINALTKGDAEDFSDMLLKANDYTHNNHNIPYPQHTAITVLNAFFISVAEKVEDLEKLTVIMKTGFTASKDLKSFTAKDYSERCFDMLDIIKQANQQPELAFLMVKGKEYFKELSLDKKMINYSSQVKINLPTGEIATFSDCGETSLRNFFWKISHLSPSALQVFFNNLEKDNSTILLHPRYIKMKGFVLDENLLDQETPQTYSTWAQIISGLNTPGSDFSYDSVAYSQSEFFEIETKFQPEKKVLGGIYNWLNVLAKLVPDKVLAENWGMPEVSLKPDDKSIISKLHKKLERLCKLSSPYLSYGLKGDLPYPTLKFSYLNEPYFECRFSAVHYSCMLLKSEEHNWGNPFHNLYFENPWVGACFNRITDVCDQDHFALSYIFNPSIKKLSDFNNIVAYLFQHKLDNLTSLFPRWIEKDERVRQAEEARSLAIKLVHVENDQALLLLEKFPFLKTEALKYLMLKQDNAKSFGKALTLHSQGINKPFASIYTSFLGMCIKKQSHYFILELLNLCQQQTIILEKEAAKKVLEKLALPKFRSSMDQSAQENCLRKIISHPIIQSLKVDFSRNLVLDALHNNYSSEFILSLVDCLKIDLNSNLGTDNLLLNAWKSRNIFLCQKLLEKGANPFILLNFNDNETQKTFFHILGEEVDLSSIQCAILFNKVMKLSKLQEKIFS